MGTGAPAGSAAVKASFRSIARRAACREFSNERGHPLDPAHYADLIDQQKITHFMASKEALAQLLETRPDGNAFMSLELVAQDNLKPAPADIAVRAHASGIKVTGLYGSSEMQALFSLCDQAAGRHSLIRRRSRSCRSRH